MNKLDFERLVGPYDAIIFDYGGVFIDIHYNEAVANLMELASVESRGEFYSQGKQSQLFDDFEMGKISSEEFILEISKILNVSKSKRDDIVNAWNSMLKEIPASRVKLLRSLRKRKRVFLLSNINQIHEDYMTSYFARNEHFSDFYELFEKVYFSHHMGMRKPNIDIFARVLKENDLDPQKTLFIDDSLQHIEGAKALGLSTYHLVPSNSLLVGD